MVIASGLMMLVRGYAQEPPRSWGNGCLRLAHTSNALRDLSLGVVGYLGSGGGLRSRV